MNKLYKIIGKVSLSIINYRIEMTQVDLKATDKAKKYQFQKGYGVSNDRTFYLIGRELSLTKKINRLQEKRNELTSKLNPSPISEAN